MSLTYAQLSDAIQQYTEVDEASFVANIPLFVQNTETLINNTVQLPVFRKNVRGETTAGFAYIDLPSDFLSLFSIAITGEDDGGNFIELPSDYLLQKDVNYIREAYPTATATGQPKHYAIFSDEALLVGPTPDKCYTLEMHYYAKPQSIVTLGSSWLGDNFPSTLLWGALLEAAIYLKSEADMVQYYQTKFAEAMSLLKQLGDGKDRIDTYRTEQVRQRVD